jgi:hypothetical protein
MREQRGQSNWKNSSKSACRSWKDRPDRQALSRIAKLAPRVVLPWRDVDPHPPGVAEDLPHGPRPRSDRFRPTLPTPQQPTVRRSASRAPCPNLRQRGLLQAAKGGKQVVLRRPTGSRSPPGHGEPSGAVLPSARVPASLGKAPRSRRGRPRPLVDNPQRPMARRERC